MGYHPLVVADQIYNIHAGLVTMVEVPLPVELWKKVSITNYSWTQGLSSQIALSALMMWDHCQWMVGIL